MCGIAGLVARRPTVSLHSMITEMTARVRHRGPDDGGDYIDGRVAFGHRRLSIIDLSQCGHQPMIDASSRYVITYNGEIYNYLALRAELSAMGQVFHSDCDTEVILAAYAAWGQDCLDRFNGMWAFAIHDRVRGVVFAARDRFGVKPFHYILTDQCFAFGSEISQLLPLLPAVTVNCGMLSDYLLTGVRTPTADTFFDRVHMLPAGHLLEYDVAEDSYRIQQFYNLLDHVTTEPESDAAALTKVPALLEDAVRLRLRSDVPVGTCLSGGVDSSSIALIAARLNRTASSSAFSAVTAVSEQERDNEEHYAEEVVRAGGLHWVRTRPEYHDFRRLVPLVIRHQEEPFATPSICMQAFVMQAARENGVVVLLDGQGADEVLLGYNRYYACYAMTLWRQNGPLAALSGMRAATRCSEDMTPPRLAAYLAFHLIPGLRREYYRLRAGYLKSHAMPTWINDFATGCRDSRSLQALEIGQTMLPELLRYEDRNSMAFSIETRLPFLDYRLVEYAVGLALSLKMRDGWTKWVLRQALSDTLPPGIGWRRRKIGFAAPTDLWMPCHQTTMIETVRDSTLLSRFCSMERLMRHFPHLDRNHQWRLYSVAAWEAAFCVGV
jgi:asparagine synthase (glutamine-hydrolysing)